MTAQPVQPARSRRTGYILSQSIAQWLYVCYTRGRAYGVANVPAAGGVILASNHQSFFDPIMTTLPLARECAYLGRDTLFDHRLLARVMRYFHCIPVKRSSADVGAIRAVIERLNERYAVLLFPEATRTPHGRVQPCQAGVALIARRARVPIVPVAIEGAFEVWPRQRSWPGLGRVWIEYAPPIAPEAFDHLNTEQAAAFLTQHLRGLHNQLRQRAGRTPFAYNQNGGSRVLTRPAGQRAPPEADGG